MSSTFLLLDDIRNCLKAAFSKFPLREPVNNGNPKTSLGEEKYRAPRLYVGQLPPKRAGETPGGDDQGEDVPYILVKCLSGDVTGENPREYQVSVGIVFEVFVPEENPEAGLQDLLNVADRILAVLASKRYWGDNRFVQVLPVGMVQGTGRADNVYASGLQIQGPYYMAAIQTQFKGAAPSQIPPPGIVDAAEPAHPAYHSEKN